MSDPIAEIELELKRYVAYRHRHGSVEYTLEDALKEHRRQVLENLRDDGDDTWITRNGMLEKLADRKGYDMSLEPTLQDLLDERRQQRLELTKANRPVPGGG